MTTSKNWARFAATALTLGITGCDPADDAVGADDLEVTFRDGDGTWGPGKLNTNFLGENEKLPLSEIPLADDPAAAVRLHAVWAKSCADPLTGQPVPGTLFYTSDLVGELGISLDGAGDLNPATFKRYGDDNVTCTIAGNGWVGTVWGVMIADGQGGWNNHYLMILDRRIDENGTPVYQWGRFTDGDNVFDEKYYTPTCIEDTDPFGVAQLYKYHAYLLSDLAVDAKTGDFSSAANTMYIACRSGIVGKTVQWGYGPWNFGMDIHERAARMGRADYCGDGNPFTVQGNPLQIRDKLGVSDFEAVTYADEAAWGPDGRAICVTMPRHKPLRVNFQGIKCAGKYLPTCTKAAMANATFATKIAH